MFTTFMDEELKEETWTISRLRALVADMPPHKWHLNFCPVCGKHASKHNDKRCNMRYEEEL